MTSPGLVFWPIGRADSPVRWHVLPAPFREAQVVALSADKIALSGRYTLEADPHGTWIVYRYDAVGDKIALYVDANVEGDELLRFYRERYRSQLCTAAGVTRWSSASPGLVRRLIAHFAPSTPVPASAPMSTPGPAHAPKMRVVPVNVGQVLETVAFDRLFTDAGEKQIARKLEARGFLVATPRPLCGFRLLNRGMQALRIYWLEQER